MIQPISDFASPPRRPFSQPPFSRWARYASYVPLYGLAFPLVKLLEAAGRWPHAGASRRNKMIDGFGEYRTAARS